MEIRKCIALFVATIVALSCYSQTQVQSRDVRRIAGKPYLYSDGNQYEIREGVVLAKLKEGKKQVREGIKVIKSHSFGMLEIAVPDSVAIEKYVKALEKTGDFECVEFDTYIKSCMIPNDPISIPSSQLWRITDTYVDGAWEITTGSPSIKVAVIDSAGFELHHPDIDYGNDSYSNMSISDFRNFACQTDSTPADSHGTMAAGIIAAKTNNGTGIAGIAGGNNCEGVKIIPCRAMESSQVMEAILYAVGKGAKVINMSLKASQSSLFDFAITTAYNNGVTLVCSAGNSGTSQIVYPASHNLTIAVGSTLTERYWDPDSNYGEGLDLVAPGVGYKSTASADDEYYLTVNGTSAAAPYVSGVVALMLSVNPNLTPGDIRYILRSTAQKIRPSTYTYNSSGWNEHVGYGLVNACAAVLAAKNCSISGPSTICSGSTGTYTVNNLPTGFSVNWYFSNGFGPTVPYIPPATNLNTTTITNNLSKSYSGTLNAAICYSNNPMITLNQHYTTLLSGFYGTVYNNQNQTTQEFYPYTPIWVTKGVSVHLRSPNLVNKNISYSVTTPSWWQYYSNTGEIYVTYPNVSTNDPIIFSVQNNPVYSDCDNSYQIIIMPNNVLPSYSLSTSVGGNGQIVVSLVKTEYSDEVKSAIEQYADKATKWDVWALDVYNAANSKKVFTKVVNGDSYAINTTGWSSGIYIVKAIYGNDVLSEKVIVP